ncbi:MAG: ChaN family lipoprotein, partial [Magnetococcus sp. WYHC-3]
MKLLLAAALALSLITRGVPMDIPVPVDTVLRLEDRHLVAPEVLLEDLSKVRVVLVGETHDDPGHHAVQHRLVQQLAQRGPVTVTLEMIPSSLQSQLQRWNAGEFGD